MNSLIYHGTLLAQRSRLDSLSSGVRGRHAQIETRDVVVGVLVLVGFAAAIWLLSYLVNRGEGRRGWSGPRRLFWSLCSAHALRWTDRWLLWRVARTQKLRDLGRLFLEPQRLHPSNLSPSLAARAAQLDRLRNRLFAQPPQDSDGPHEEDPKTEPEREPVAAADQ